MGEVFREYGGYLVAVISCGLILFGVSKIMGLFGAVNTSLSGNGVFGKLVCLYLNMIM